MHPQKRRRTLPFRPAKSASVLAGSVFLTIRIDTAAFEHDRGFEAVDPQIEWHRRAISSQPLAAENKTSSQGSIALVRLIQLLRGVLDALAAGLSFKCRFAKAQRSFPNVPGPWQHPHLSSAAAMISFHVTNGLGAAQVGYSYI